MDVTPEFRTGFFILWMAAVGFVTVVAIEFFAVCADIKRTVVGIKFIPVWSDLIMNFNGFLDVSIEFFVHFNMPFAAISTRIRKSSSVNCLSSEPGWQRVV